MEFFDRFSIENSIRLAFASHRTTFSPRRFSGHDSLCFAMIFDYFAVESGIACPQKGPFSAIQDLRGE
jgi:hypothetical protein